MRVTCAAIAVLGLTACGTPSDPSPPGPATYRITPSALWAGGTVTIESSAFRDLGDGAELDLGLTSIALVRVDDTTMTATLPGDAGGIYDPVVVMEDSLALLEQVEVWGFAATRRYGPESVWLPWDTYVWPRGEPQVIAGTNNGELAIIDLDTEEIRTIPGVFYPTIGLRGPGATPDDNVLLLKPQGQPLQSWQFGAVPQKLGEHPEIGGNRQVLRLGLHSWLVTWNNRVEVWLRPDSSAAYTVAANYPLNEPQGVHLSPRKDRATLRVNAASVGATPGVPVFDAPSGDLAYYAPVQSAQGVDWSADGGLLAMAGREQPGNPYSRGRIVIMDATSGTVVASVTSELPVFAVAFDDLRPYLYVGVTSLSGHLAVEVYRRTDLTRLALLEVPDSDAGCGTGDICEGGVLAVGAEELHAFYGWNGPARNSRFFLPAP